jgi:hypothetical protein
MEFPPGSLIIIPLAITNSKESESEFTEHSTWSFDHYWSYEWIVSRLDGSDAVHLLRAWRDVSLFWFKLYSAFGKTRWMYWWGVSMVGVCLLFFFTAHFVNHLQLQHSSNCQKKLAMFQCSPGCGRSFGGPAALSNHQKYCATSKQCLASALAKLKQRRSQALILSPPIQEVPIRSEVRSIFYLSI